MVLLARGAQCQRSNGTSPFPLCTGLQGFKALDMKIYNQLTRQLKIGLLQILWFWKLQELNDCPLDVTSHFLKSTRTPLGQIRDSLLVPA